MSAKKQTGMLIRDCAMLLFLITVMLSVLVVVYANRDDHVTYMTLLFMTFLVAVIGFFSRGNVGVVLAGATVVGFAAYKLYGLYVSGIPIARLDYAWLGLPLIIVAAVSAFNRGSSAVERENEMLRSQVEDLVMVDALTGQLNLRAFYYELPKTMKYAERLQQPFTLMIIKLRYERELRAMLPRHRYEKLLQQFAECVALTIRIMDRSFSIDDVGSMAVLFMCDAEGAEAAKNRLRAAIGAPETFSDILDRNLRVDVNIAFMEYDKSISSPQEFKLRVESELAYDV